MLLEDPDLASLMWERIRDVVPSEFVIGDSSADLPEGFQENLVADMQGSWKASGVNTFFSLLHYCSGGHFGPHRDGYVIKLVHERSILTLSVYLASGFASEPWRSNQLSP